GHGAPRLFAGLAARHHGPPDSVGGWAADSRTLGGPIGLRRRSPARVQGRV
ncbi:MAG: hypothetical protein AVDCRST_MAG59-2772, partial [uncultured Thermomicrobiales bacterium]